MTCLFSKLSPDNPNCIPQVVGIKPLVGFTPMHEDGCMLLIFPEKYKKGKPIPEAMPEQ